MIETYILYAAFILCIVVNIEVSRQAYKIYKLLNHGNQWWIICLGFIIMAVRSAASIVTLNNYPESSMLSNQVYILNVGILPVVASLLILFGVKRLYRAAIHNKNIEVFAEKRMLRIKKIQKRMDRYESKKIVEALYNDNRRCKA